MRINKLSYWVLTLFLAGVFTGCKNDDPDKNDFGNKVYINSTQKTTTTFIKASLQDFSQTLEAATAKPVKNDVRITFKADPSLLSTFNKAYYAEAIILPSENYKIEESKALIQAGSARSTEIVIDFKDIKNLDRDLMYVLPVTMCDAGGLNVLKSARTMYYVFKGGAIIDVVGDIEKNYCTVNWATPELVNNMTKLTMEALVRARYFIRNGSDSNIASIMGIEQNFLIRCGDSNFPAGQIQIATSGGNFPGGDASKVLPTNTWVHIAVTFDGETKTIKIYVDGILQSEASNAVNRSSFNLTSSTQGEIKGFFIGASWNANRYWPGEISECRLWNVVRTQEEIAGNVYEVDPQTEGLVGYWKFDDGTGSNVKDHTGNGNDAVGKTPIKWNPVSLPPSK